MNVVIACGGTGGHLFPGVAVAEVLIERKHDVLLLVSEKEIDRVALQGRASLQARQLPSIGWPRGLSIQTAKFLWQLFKARGFCRKLYEESPPDVVLAMGGFTSAAPMWEAQRLGVPTLIHEANVIPGRANRILAKSATRVVVGFREAAGRFDPEKVVVGGTPVRNELKARPNRAAARQELGFSADAPLILVMGGSQGARGLNSCVIESLPHLRSKQIQWAHLCGKGEEQRVEQAYRDGGFKARVWPFFSEMQKLYAAADLAVSRAGAASITEINFFGLPAVYVPYPFAADKHQTANAKVEVNAGAGLCFDEAELTGKILAGEIERLLSDRSALAKMAEASRKLAAPEAAAKLADLACELAERHRTGPILKV